MTTYKAKILINVDRTADRITFELSTEGSPTHVTMSYATSEPKFLRKVRDLIDEALDLIDEPEGS